MLVQKEYNVKPIMRVAPLFETLDDLDHSEEAIRSLLSNDWYHSHIKGEQECMIGYSDSGKDAGRLAAAWGLYEVQVRLSFFIYFAPAKQYSENLVDGTYMSGISV